MLPLLLKNLGVGEASSFDLIAASSYFNLFQILSNVTPDIVVIRFKETTINEELCDRLIGIPILVLHDKKEEDPTFCSNKHIVFTECIEDCTKPDFLKSKVESIFEVLEQDKEEETKEKAILKRYALEIEKKNRILIQIQKKLQKYMHNGDQINGKEIRSMVYSIKSNLQNSLSQNQYSLYTNHQELVSFIKQRFPKLTNDDLKYCSYLKMNMSNREIAEQLGISQDSVRTHKYRLKKKMALSKGENLQNYIHGVHHNLFKLSVNP